MSDDALRVKRIYDRVPGFQDYSRSADRGAADRLFRACLARELTDQRDRLSELEVELLGRSDRRAGEIDRAVMELELLIDIVKAFDASDAPWLNRERLREEDVEVLHRIDAILLRYNDRIAQKVTEIIGCRVTVDLFAPLVGDILITLREMTEKLERRAEVIQSPLA